MTCITHRKELVASLTVSIPDDASDDQDPVSNNDKKGKLMLVKSVLHKK